jgi:hypothetical protein
MIVVGLSSAGAKRLHENGGDFRLAARITAPEIEKVNLT